MTDESIGRDETSADYKNLLAELLKRKEALEAELEAGEARLKKNSDKLKRYEDAHEKFLEKAFVHSIDDSTYWARVWITSLSVASGALAAAMGSTILGGHEFPYAVKILRMALLSLAFSGMAPFALAFVRSFESELLFRKKLNPDGEDDIDLPTRGVARLRSLIAVIAAGLVGSSVGLLTWSLLLIAIHAPEAISLRNEVVAPAVASGEKHSDEVPASAFIEDGPVSTHQDEGNAAPE